MLKSLSFFIRFYFLWLLFFAADRLLFLLIFHDEWADVSFNEVMGVFYHGLPLDLSMTAYISIAPLLYFVYGWLRGQQTSDLKWLKIYTNILLLIFSILSVVNFNIFREWGTKLNDKAINFALHTPNEALASTASSPIVFTLLMLLMLIALGFLLNRLLLPKTIVFNGSPFWLKSLICILLIGINFLLIRGGIDVSPVNQSMAYFSDKDLLNQAAVNTEWNLMRSMLVSARVNKNHYDYLPQKEASKRVEALYKATKDSTIYILNTKRPNVMVVIMESFTADLTSALSGDKGITPKFDSLVREGVFFNKIYSTGNRTDKGIVGTLAGFPSLAAASLVNFPQKMQNIPAISQEFKRNGYQTSFFYGGESEFDNYKAFILSHSYDKLIDKNKFNQREMNSKWGAYDGVVLARQLKELNATRQPFFSTLMTLTNHEPFEVPGTYKFGTSDNATRFKSTAFYTDSCINDFLNKAKLQSWYKNTLFIFLADHGHHLPKGITDVYVPQRYHIPLLFFGDVIKKEFRGKVFDHVGSQIDVASTLLSQLNMNTKPFTWSKNMLNPFTQSFAFFSWDNGMGFIDNKQCVTFDNTGKRILYNDLKQDKKSTTETLKQGQAFLQTIYQQFIEL